MNIFFICHRLITFILNDIVELDKLQHDITILSTHKDRVLFNKITRPFLIEHGLLDNVFIRYKSIRSRKERFAHFAKIIFSDLFTRPLLTLRSVFYLLRLYKNLGIGIEDYHDIRQFLSEDFNIIHSPFSTPEIIDKIYFMSCVKQIPYTLSFRAHDLFSGDNFSETIKKKYIINGASQLITISNYNKQFIENNLKPSKDIEVIHGAVDSNFFCPENTKKIKNRIISVCRLHEQKGIIYLLKACHILKKRGYLFDCIIIGEGPEKSDCLDFIHQHNLSNVKLCSYLDRDGIKTELAKSEFFVLPCVISSDGSRDILPNALKEAMSMELPVITSDICGIHELVENGKNGILTSPKDHKDIAGAIEKLFNNNKLRVKMGKAGRIKILNDFNLSVEAKKLESVFKRAIL